MQAHVRRIAELTDMAPEDGGRSKISTVGTAPATQKRHVRVEALGVTIVECVRTEAVQGIDPGTLGECRFIIRHRQIAFMPMGALPLPQNA